jgi:hypothetical protein
MICYFFGLHFGRKNVPIFLQAIDGISIKKLWKKQDLTGRHNFVTHFIKILSVNNW